MAKKKSKKGGKKKGKKGGKKAPKVDRVNKKELLCATVKGDKFWDDLACQIQREDDDKFVVIAKIDNNNLRQHSRLVQDQEVQVNEMLREKIDDANARLRSLKQQLPDDAKVISKVKHAQPFSVGEFAAAWRSKETILKRQLLMTTERVLDPRIQQNHTQSYFLNSILPICSERAVWADVQGIARHHMVTLTHEMDDRYNDICRLDSKELIAVPNICEIERQDHQRVMCISARSQACSLYETASQNYRKDLDFFAYTSLLHCKAKLLNADFQKKVQEIMSKTSIMFTLKAYPVKTQARMQEQVRRFSDEGKVAWPTTAHICDPLKCSITCSTVEGVLKAIELIRKSKRMKVVKCQNKFRQNPTRTGWRDVTFNCLFESRGTKIITEIVVCDEILATHQRCSKRLSYICEAPDSKSCKAQFDEVQKNEQDQMNKGLWGKARLATTSTKSKLADKLANIVIAQKSGHSN